MFDICIPSYNREIMLEKMVRTIPNEININISDNGGFYQDCHFIKNTENISLRVSETVVSMFENWSLAASLSKQPFFLLPSDDDIYYPEMKSIVTNVLKEISADDIDHISMIVFGHDVIDEFDNKVSSWVPSLEGICDSSQAFDFFRFGVDARMPSILINKKQYQDIGGFDSIFKFTAADSELVQKLSLSGKVIFSKKIISAYRVWSESATHKKIASREWGQEIEQWTKNISTFLYSKNYNSVYINETKDEIILRNIIAGVYYADSIKSMIGFLSFEKYPRHAKIKSHIQLVIQILKKLIRK